MHDLGEVQPLIEYGKKIPMHNFDIYTWVPEFILGALVIMCGVFLMRVLQKIEKNEEKVQENSDNLKDYKNKTDAVIAIHSTEIVYIRQGIEEVKKEQRETNRRIQATNDRLDKLISIQSRAHGIE